jgi:hypothetical protein
MSGVVVARKASKRLSAECGHILCEALEREQTASFQVLDAITTAPSSANA